MAPNRKPAVFRPRLDDVERLSQGKSARQRRGTGHRAVCHRLDQNERRLYELAKRSSYLALRGTGYRKNRKGSPLWNTFRQRRDALESLCVVIEKRADTTDRVVIDFSTLRVRCDDAFVESILENVIREKYPDLYAQASECRAKIRRAPIDWEAVRTKPIWGVDPRLVAVSCERDVAKSLAMDVLEECSKFSFDDETTVHDAGNVGGDARAGIAGDTDSVVVDDDDDGIDWDDI